MLLAYHNDKAIKSKYLNRLTAHSKRMQEGYERLHKMYGGGQP